MSQKYLKLKEFVEDQKHTNIERDNLHDDLNAQALEIKDLKQRLESKSTQLTESAVTLVEQGEKIKDLQDILDGQNKHVNNLESALRNSQYGGKNRAGRGNGQDDDSFEAVLRKEFEEMRKKFEKQIKNLQDQL